MIKTMVEHLMVQQQLRARKDNLTKTFCKISQSRSVPAWQIEDTAGYVATTRHVGGEIQETTQDDRTVPVMGQAGGQ